jgi:hypothetical protein
MATDRAIEFIDRQRWLQPLAERLQSSLNDTVAAGGPAGQQVANALHGVWLGHPLHPVLTDLPIGSWTVAAVLDAFVRETVYAQRPYQFEDLERAVRRAVEG